jgi:hypothetical protein
VYAKKNVWPYNKVYQIWNELIDGVQVDMGGGDKKELEGWK